MLVVVYFTVIDPFSRLLSAKLLQTYHMKPKEYFFV